jgi:hypothetical protein
MKNQNKNQSFTDSFTDDEDILNKELEKELEIPENGDSSDDLNQDDDKKIEEKDKVNDEVRQGESSSGERVSPGGEGDLGQEEATEEEKEEDKGEEKSESYIKAQLLKIQTQVNQLLGYLDGVDIPRDKLEKGITVSESIKLKKEESEDGQSVVEGVFTGEEMIGPDGKRYSIPSNYASKSKLLEGDILKLIIKRDGTFVYKQIGPVDRDRLIGTLIKNDTSDQYYAMVDGERWKLLKASVTFFKGDVGDEIIILVPADAKSKWAAVENIVKKA